MRALIVVAVALAASQALGVSGAHAQDADARTYEALVVRPFSMQAAGSLSGTCGTRADDGTGDDGCGSMSGGPAGGNSSRN